MRKTSLPFLITIILLLSFGFSAMYIFSADDDAALKLLTGTGGRQHHTGSFYDDYGNAGEISFDMDTAPEDRAHFYGTGLSGYFWVQNVGWTEFKDAYISQKNIGDAARESWDVSGYAWNNNAGWFTIATGTVLDPVSRTLSGWIWSDTLGWNSLQSSVNTMGQGFMGRVRVIGTIAGENIFSTQIANYDQGQTFNATSVTSIVNQIQKSVYLNTRNLDDSINRLPLPSTPDLKTINGVAYFQYSGTGGMLVTWGSIESVFGDPSVRTVVIIGADLYMDRDLVPPLSHLPKAIITLKNPSGVGGNIYVQGSVHKIFSSLIADGTLYSGKWDSASNRWILYSTSSTQLYPPNHQLYIKGSIISRNTIGGAGILGGSRCPFTEQHCTYDQALRYDLNYFRDFQTGSITPSDIPSHRAYTDDTLDDQSLIIEYDPRVILSPPPGI